MLRAIFFDLDDTLIYEEQTIAHAFTEAAGKCATVAGTRGLDSNRLISSVRRIVREMWLELQGEERWGTKIGVGSWEVLYGDFSLGDAPLLKTLREQAPKFRQQAWQAALREFGINDPRLAGELADTFRVLARCNAVLLPETLEVLEAVKCNYRLGMITNGAPDIQRSKVESAGIKHYFESIVISGDIGVGKPQKEIFEYALQAMSVSPRECIMVGNSFERDIKGSIGADIRAAWLNLHKEEPPRTRVRYHTIANLRDLIPLIEDLRRR